MSTTRPAAKLMCCNPVTSGATDQIYLTAAVYNGLGQATDTYRYAKAMALNVAAPRMGTSRPCSATAPISTPLTISISTTL